MSLLAELAAEHALFHGLLDRVDRAAALEESAARPRLKELLLLLVPALDEHEQIEDEAFRLPPKGARPAERRVIAELGIQHRRLDLLKDRIREALGALERLAFDELRELARRLTLGLRVHMDKEERRLWPRYRRAMTSARDRVLARRTRARVRSLERGMRERGVLLEYYLGGSA